MCIEKRFYGKDGRSTFVTSEWHGLWLIKLKPLLPIEYDDGNCLEFSDRYLTVTQDTATSMSISVKLHLPLETWVSFLEVVDCHHDFFMINKLVNKFSRPDKFAVFGVSLSEAHLRK